MPLNEHLLAYNAARDSAEMEGRSTFLFRGKKYVRHRWKNGVPVWKRDRKSKKKSSNKGGKKKSKK